MSLKISEMWRGVIFYYDYFLSVWVNFDTLIIKIENEMLYKVCSSVKIIVFSYLRNYISSLGPAQIEPIPRLVHV